MSYTCGHCTSTHERSYQALACSQRGAAAARVMHTEPGPTPKQLKFYRELCTKKGHDEQPVPGTKRLMSDRISYLLTLKDATVDLDKLPPLDMLNLVRAGRYAVPNLELTEYIFVRVARPKTGRSAGQTIVQTRHGDAWTERLRYHSNGRLVSRARADVKGMDLSDVIIAIITDQTTAAIEYATRAGCCARCGKELTDDRSRFYGIGPECEKDWPHFTGQVEDKRGAYAPGAASR